ncbi:uncharacterized protein UDID_01140 [Ustilago sp. UG-2017a]|nr:uncharacterized protein UDID_01140 [Ustilago sp. UG-2017a]
MSNGASFVKRSKPRSSADRISSSYNDDDGKAGPSTSSSRLASASDDVSRTSEHNSRSTTPRRTLSAIDVDEDEDAGPPNVVFRTRAKGAKATPTSATSTIVKAPSSGEWPMASAMDEDKDQDDADAFEIRRSKLNIAGKHARKAGTSIASASSTTEGTPKRLISIRPTSLQVRPPPDIAAAEATPSNTSNLYTSKYLDELRSSTPTTRSRAHSPTPTTFGPGTRIDDPMVAQTSYISLDDPTDDDALARSKFPSDFAHDTIPSESVIRAAKEKRAKLRAAAPAGKDFISIAPSPTSSALKSCNRMEVDDGPHPHSRLQREEDEFGDGEEEFAEYTGATERIPIGEKAEKEWKERQRREMEAAVQGDLDQDADVPVEEEVDEDEVEWERAQLSRTQPFAHSTSSSRARSREPSPFTPASIPAATPLPSVGTCSTRLALTLRALEQSTSASEAVVKSTTKELETLDEAEKENKLNVVAMEEKASWFDELDEFVGSLARFMEEKMDEVEVLETETVELAARRTRMLGKKRTQWFEDKLEQGLGLRPSSSVVPDFAKEQNEEEEAMDTTIETARNKEVHDVSQLDQLTPADELSYSLARQSVLSKLQYIFSEVQAPEYLHPAATASTTSSKLPFLSSSHRLEEFHPRSVVSRFQDWRRLYPEEYSQVWGGLSVAQIWEFYARCEMIPWDTLPSSQGENEAGWKSGAEAIAHFSWFNRASDYTDHAGADPIGGDEEVLSSLLSKVLVDKLIQLANKGVYSPWSERQTREAVEAVDLVQTVLGNGHARCVGLIEAYLRAFGVQVRRLQEVLRPAAVQYSPGGEEQVAREVAQELVDALLKNLVRWSRIVSFSSTESAAATVAKLHLQLLEDLVSTILETFGSHSALAAEVCSSVVNVVPRHIAARLDSLAAPTQT